MNRCTDAQNVMHLLTIIIDRIRISKSGYQKKLYHDITVEKGSMRSAVELVEIK